MSPGAAWQYSVSTLQFRADEVADGTVDASMRKWTEAGWELVSGSAAAFTVPLNATPYIKYVTYWRKPVVQQSVSPEPNSGRVSHELREPSFDPQPSGPGAPTAEVFDLTISDAGTNKIAVIKVVRDATGWGIKEAKALVDSVPQPFGSGLKPYAAENLAAALRSAGATVDVRSRAAPPG